MEKTIIGKNNYLFLNNDTSNSLINHCNDNYKKEINLNRYNLIINKFLLIVFPDKECICSNLLPDNFTIKNRYSLDYYKLELNNKLLDTTDLLDYTDYYVTDTHMNIKGLYKIYKESILKFNKLFNKNISILESELKNIIVDNLTSLQLGLGDLTWDTNKLDLVLNNISDIYYISEHNFPFYCKLKILNPLIIDDINIKILNTSLENITSNYLDSVITWNILSETIISSVCNNIDNNLKILIFYDSFLVSIIPLIMKTFKYCFFSKSHVNQTIVDNVNPDYILEFRIERFL
jgi:hypothetical protein